MRLGLIDVLRCPADHPDSTLVLSADTWRDGDVWEGRLGCPVCHATYPIDAGGVDFTGGSGLGSNEPRQNAATPEEAMRLAAQLDLREPGGIVLLTGAYAGLAAPLSGVVDTTVLSLNGGTAGGATALTVGARLPLAPGSVRGAALDGLDRAGHTLDQLLPALRQGARIVARPDVLVAAGITELARDDREWVGEVTAPVSGLVRLGRRRDDA